MNDEGDTGDDVVFNDEQQEDVKIASTSGRHGRGIAIRRQSRPPP